MIEQVIDHITTGRETSKAYLSKYYLKKMFIFIRQVLKDSYCIRETIEKQTLLKMAELRLGGFIRQEDPTFFEKRNDLEQLKRYLNNACHSEEAAYQAEVLIDELDRNYQLSAMRFINRTRFRRTYNQINTKRSHRTI